MRVTITINCDNAAFDDENGPQEVARILARLAKDFNETDRLVGGVSDPVRDVNGNPVGVVTVTDKRG